MMGVERCATNDAQAELLARARAYRSGREIVEALAGLTGEEGEIVCQEDALIAEIDFALQSEREATAAEARRAALATIFDGLEGAFTDESCVLIDEYIKDCEEEIDKADREFRSGDGIFWWTLTQLLRNARRLLASPPAPQETTQ